MKTRFWAGIALWMSCNAIIAATPTMQYASQPPENVYSLPLTLTLNNLAPVPQNLCSPTLSTGGERATCSGLPVCQGFSSQTASFSCSVTTTCDSTVPSSKNGGSCSVILNATKPSDINASTPFSFTVSYGSYNALLISNAFTL
ncbi:MAG: hypothetical protein B7X00_01560, partial [Legionella sp. 21-45-4]